MTGSTVEEIAYLLRNGAGHDMAPHMGAEILDDITNYTTRYIAYPNKQASHTHTLWIAHTYLLDCWRASPRIAFLSPEPGSGKTRALQITRELVPRKPIIAIEPTTAYLFNAIDEYFMGTPTFLLDEIDTIFDNRTGENRHLRRFINASLSPGASIPRASGRTQKGKRGRTRKFPIYCAIAVAGILDDLHPTIRSRSIIIRMHRRAPHQKLDQWRETIPTPEIKDLHDRLMMWAELVHHHATTYWPDLPEGIEDRDADVWEPLIAVADLAGGHWPETARVTASASVTASGMKQSLSAGMQLLRDTRTIFNKLSVSRIQTRDLLTELETLDESIWAGTTAMRLGVELKRYGIIPTRWNSGRIRGYVRTDFNEAWSRYLPPEAVTVTEAVTEAVTREAQP